MRRIRITAAGALLFAIAPAAPQAGAASMAPAAIYARAVSAPGRSDQDHERDAREQPAAVLAFAGFRPGMRIADLFGGGGYYSEILDHVVGPRGHVLLVNNPPYAAFAKEDLERRFRDGRLPRIERRVVPSEDLQLGVGTLDGALFVMSYHDLYFEHGADFPRIDAAQFLEQLRRAMRPGARLLVVDHAAPAGSGLAHTNDTHRIDPAKARSEIEKAGFVFDGETKILASPDDPHTALVFDPTIRGKTDRFAYRFRKQKS